MHRAVWSLVRLPLDDASFIRGFIAGLVTTAIAAYCYWTYSGPY
jgi:hypothetical protein